MRQHGEKGAGEEPGDDRLAQYRQSALDHRLGMRRLARRRQAEGGKEQEREHAGAKQRKALDACQLEDEAADGDGDDEADRAPEPDPAVAGDVDLAAAG